MIQKMTSRKFIVFILTFGSAVVLKALGMIADLYFTILVGLAGLSYTLVEGTIDITGVKKVKTPYFEYEKEVKGVKDEAKRIL